MNTFSNNHNPNLKCYYHYTKVTNTPFSMPIVQKIIQNTLKKINNSGIGKKTNSKIRIVDSFAREYRQLGCITISNDLNPEFDTMYNLEANDFGELILQKFEFNELEPFDLCFHDPPYNLTMLKKHYDGIGENLPQWQCRNMWGRNKDALAKTIKPGGYVISCQWHSHGYGKRRGFEKVEIHNIEHSGNEDKYNLQVVVEKKVQQNLLNFETTRSNYEGKMS